MVSWEFAVLLAVFVGAAMYFRERIRHMTDIAAQIQADVDANAAAVAQAFDDVSTEIATIQQTVADLKTQIINNDSKAAIQASLTKLEESTGKVQQISAAAKAAIAPTGASTGTGTTGDGTGTSGEPSTGASTETPPSA